MKHLILALGGAGLGETAVGRRLADELRDAGHAVRTVIDAAAHPLFAGSGHDVRPLPPVGWGSVERTILDAASDGPASLVFADYISAINVLQHRGANPRFLHGLQARTIFVDTWHAAEVGGLLDAGPGGQFRYDPTFATDPHRLVPVPFVRPEVAGGFSILPPAPRPDRTLHEGLPTGAKVLFLATSRWQHERAAGSSEALRQAFPHLLAELLDQLDASVHVLHVGPSTLPFQDVLGARYHWRPTLPAGRFGATIAAADAVLSLNLAATTNTVAVAAGVPVVTLHNTCEGSPDALEAQLGRPLQPFVRRWAEAQGTLFPFVMWPYAMQASLEPVFAGNPYGDLLHRTAVLDAERVRDTLHALLFDGTARDDARHRMARYAARLAALPTGAQRIMEYCEA